MTVDRSPSLFRPFRLLAALAVAAPALAPGLAAGAPDDASSEAPVRDVEIVRTALDVLEQDAFDAAALTVTSRGGVVTASGERRGRRHRRAERDGPDRVRAPPGARPRRAAAGVPEVELEELEVALDG